MKILVAGLVLLLSQASYGDELKCIDQGKGWALANMSKNFFFGPANAIYYSKTTCEQVRTTQVENGNGFGIVCAQNPSGTSIYTLDGNLLGNGSFYYQSSSCVTAIWNMSDWVVCSPYAPGSVLLDLKTGRQIGANGYYKTVAACSRASASASRRDGLVCGPIGNGSAIYDRNTNRPVNTRRFTTTEECYNKLRAK